MKASATFAHSFSVSLKWVLRCLQQMICFKKSNFVQDGTIRHLCNISKATLCTFLTTSALSWLKRNLLMFPVSQRVIGTKLTNSEKSWEGFKSYISWQQRKILDTSWPPPKPWSKPCHDYDHDQLTINHCQHFFSVHDVSTCQKVRGGPWVHGWCCLWGWGRHTPTRNSLCGQQVYKNHSFSETCIKI